MTEWTTHVPAFDGDAPEGVGLDTHEVQYRFSPDSQDKWKDLPNEFADGVSWMTYLMWRYRPRNPPATYAQVKAYCEHHGLPVPPKPVDYEAWAGALDAFRKAARMSERSGHFAQQVLGHDIDRVKGLIAAMRIAMTIPACMEDVKG